MDSINSWTLYASASFTVLRIGIDFFGESFYSCVNVRDFEVWKVECNCFWTLRGCKILIGIVGIINIIEGIKYWSIIHRFRNRTRHIQFNK